MLTDSVPMAEARRIGYSPMDVPEGFSPTLILVLNLVGTFVRPQRWVGGRAGTA